MLNVIPALEPLLKIAKESVETSKKTLDAAGMDRLLSIWEKMDEETGAARAADIERTIKSDLICAETLNAMKTFILDLDKRKELDNSITATLCDALTNDWLLEQLNERRKSAVSVGGGQCTKGPEDQGLATPCPRSGTGLAGGLK